MSAYLEFEKEIKQIDDDIVSAKIRGDSAAVEILKKNLEKEISKTYKNLTEFQRLQLARHPDRPYAIDYIKTLLTNAYEIHGDRAYRDDPAIVCYIGYISNKKFVNNMNIAGINYDNPSDGEMEYCDAREGLKMVPKEDIFFSE